MEKEELEWWPTIDECHALWDPSTEAFCGEEDAQMAQMLLGGGGRWGLRSVHTQAVWPGGIRREWGKRNWSWWTQMVVSRVSFVEGPRENGHKVERKERLPPTLRREEMVEMYFYRACNLIDTHTVFSLFYLCEVILVRLIILHFFGEGK